MHLPHFVFTFKTKLRHLNKKWYPGGIQMMHTVVLNAANTLFWGLNKYQNNLFASRNIPLCYL